MRRWAFLIVLAVLGCLAGSGGARAQAAFCSLSTASMPFGTISALSGGPANASLALGVNCISVVTPNTSTLCVSVGSGATPQLSSGSATLPVEVLDSVAATTQIGTGSPYPMYGPITVGINPYLTVVTLSVPLVGIIPAQSALPAAGSYSANIPYTVYVAGPGATSCTAVLASPDLYSVSDTISATATVSTQCNVVATAMNFGSASLWTSPLTATANITVTCNTADTVTVMLDNGTTGTGPTTRQMTSGSNTVTYGIYRDSNRTLPWGNTAGNSQQAALSGASSVTLTAYGAIPVQTGVTPGSYSDVVNVTVTY